MINKIQLNYAQFELATSWLPDGSQPYAYNPDKGILWYLQPHYSGVVVQNSTKLSPDQLVRLNQLMQLDQFAD